MEIFRGDHTHIQTHTHTDTHKHTHTDTHRHTQTHTQTHAEAHFISLAFLRKCRNKTKNGYCKGNFFVYNFFFE